MDTPTFDSGFSGIGWFSKELDRFSGLDWLGFQVLDHGFFSDLDRILFLG
ncbi:MAG TPA: hypothetical protein VG890_12410 [Puia sp.]|nr:hypothetical protein [Puia sp.]